MQSNVTVSFLSALCISSFSSAGAKWRSGTRHPDNEKMRGAEAMKGNIPSNMPHSSLFGPLSLCSVPHPTSQLLFPGRTPSWALCGEQEAGLEACCLRAKASGYETSAWKKVATFPIWTKVKLTAMFKRPEGKYRGWKPWGSEPEHSGAQTRKPALSRWAQENMQRSLIFSYKK